MHEPAFGQSAFILINSYTTGLQPLVLYNILSRLTKSLGGKVDAQEAGLPVTREGLYFLRRFGALEQIAGGARKLKR